MWATHREIKKTRIIKYDSILTMVMIVLSISI